MKKTITIAATLLSVSFFSATASANSFGQDVDGDILYGNGAVSASPGAPYIANSGIQNQIETDMLSNRHEFEQSSAYQAYELVSGEQDNRDNLRDQVS